MLGDNKKSIQTVVEEQTDFLLTLNGVFSVAIGKTEDDLDCILIHLEKITNDIQKKIPEKIDGYFVTLIESDQPTLF